MRAVALASGSNGNAIYVETRDARLLFDTGLSAKRLVARAALRDVDLGAVDALLLSHDHADHTSGAGVAHRRFGMPVLATRGTWRRIGRRVGKIRVRRTFRRGEELRFGGTRVETIGTPHDGAEGVCFVVEDGGRRLGILTDLGHPFPALLDAVATLDGAFLEANYDPALLEEGPYPWHLKERIAGPGGHLSNEECARVAAGAGRDRLRHLVLCHLSGENNTAELALRAALPLAESGVEVRLAGRSGPSEVLLLAD